MDLLVLGLRLQFCRHVQITVWPPGWLITSSPSENPSGQDIAPAGPAGPCGPVGPAGPVATLIVTVLGSAALPKPTARAVRNPEPPANSNPATSRISSRFTDPSALHADRRCTPASADRSSYRPTSPLPLRTEWR